MVAARTRAEKAEARVRELEEELVARDDDRRMQLGISPSVGIDATKGSPPRQQGVDAGSPGGADAPSLPDATSPTPAGAREHSRSCNLLAHDYADENDGACDCGSETGGTE